MPEGTHTNKIQCFQIYIKCIFHLRMQPITIYIGYSEFFMNYLPFAKFHQKYLFHAIIINKNFIDIKTSH